MAAITATPIPEHRDRPHQWRRARTREALAAAVRQGAAMASAARRHYRRPALVIGSFAAGVASAWHTFGSGAGLAALCIAGLVFESLGSEE